MPGKMSYSQYLECPLCSVEIPLSGDESVGEELSCPYCQSPLLLRMKKENEKDILYLEDDF